MSQQMKKKSSSAKIIILIINNKLNQIINKCSKLKSQKAHDSKKIYLILILYIFMNLKLVFRVVCIIGLIYSTSITKCTHVNIRQTVRMKRMPKQCIMIIIIRLIRL